MRKLNPDGSFPLALIVFSLVLGMYKAASLSIEMTGSLARFISLFSLDLSFLMTLLLLAVVYGLTSHSWMRVFLKILLALAVAFYVVHSFVLLALDEAMSLFDLVRYLQEWRVVGSFFDAPSIIAISLFVVALFLNLTVGRRTLARAAGFAVLMLGLGLIAEARAPLQLQKYGLLKFHSYSEQVLQDDNASVYSAEQIEFYARARPAEAGFIQSDPDIILLIVESLSSINSFKVSGERNLLQSFDQLADEGVLFINFFANHPASEGGIISMLSGFPPLHFPTATPLMFDEFANQPSVLGEYREHGYFTEFLTNTDLGFIGMDRYVAGLNFDLARGRDEVPEFSAAPRFVQDAPSDRYLYAEALNRVRERADSAQPWFMVLATVSTHLPYAHPEGGEDTAEAVWQWSLDRLQEFYQALTRQGFFENGVLLITGDHRQMRPLTSQEMARYGDSAKARIPLLAIGAGMPGGTVDGRFFQQSDLLRFMNSLNQPGLALSPQPIWVERYNRIYGKVESINRFAVFDQANGGMTEYPVRVSGAQLQWTGERPVFSRLVEARVHAQRSGHQFRRNGTSRGCGEPYSQWNGQASGRSGLLMDRFEGSSVSDLQPAAMGTVQVPDLGQSAISSVPQAQPMQLFRYRAYLDIETPGTYWFRTSPGNQVCLHIDQQLVLDQLQPGTGTQGSIELDAGLYAMDFRHYTGAQESQPALQWVVPGSTRWRWRSIPVNQYRVPELHSGSVQETGQ